MRLPSRRRGGGLLVNTITAKEYPDLSAVLSPRGRLTVVTAKRTPLQKKQKNNKKTKSTTGEGPMDFVNPPLVVCQHATK